MCRTYSTHGNIDEKYTMNDEFFFYIYILFFALVEFFNLILILHKIIAIFCASEETMVGGFAADAEEHIHIDASAMSHVGNGIRLLWKGWRCCRGGELMRMGCPLLGM